MSNYRTNNVERFAELFGALSNPNRLRIFLNLVSCCAPGTRCSTEAGLRACVGQVAENLGIAPSTVSHHVAKLRTSGVIRMERQGQRIECWVDPEILRDLAEFFTTPTTEQRSTQDERDACR